MDPRHHALEVLFSADQAAKIRSSKVLLVGAGGIGCELLKDLVVAGVGEVHLVDLDTIDLSNLNRQFLFGNEHIKQPKATVAAEVAARFNTNVHIVPYMADIMSPQFNAKWFDGFALVFNALDNATARRHVNRMCIATSVPLIDVGSEGFNGQSQVILPQKTECYDCFAHPTPTTYPVCTIRSTPTQPVHCIVWAKSFLLATLFGEDAPQEQDTDAERAQEQAVEQAELVTLKKNVGQPGFVGLMVQKVFVSDMERLAKIDTMWEDREPPTPLEVPNYDPDNADAGEDVVAQDQQVWSVLENLQALVTASYALVKRQQAGSGPIDFDKDDDDTLDFVCAAANLRAKCFGIAPQTKWETKSIAGNIIPAVATTNAIVAGLSTIEALKLLSHAPERDLRSVYISKSDTKVLTCDKLQPRNEDCVICSIARSTASVPTATTTLGDLVEKLLRLKLGYDDVSIITDKLIYDVDFDDNANETIEVLGLANKFITIVDDEDRKVNLELYIEEGDEPSIQMVDVPLQRPKRERDSEDVETPEPDAKKPETDLYADDIIEL